MKNRRIGLILILISIIFLTVTVIFKLQINNLVDALMIETGGTCIQEGKCIHEQSNLPVYIGIAVVFINLALGLFFIFFERSQEQTEKIHSDVVNALKETKKKQDSEERFEILLKALNEEEKKVIKAVKEQDGIEQSTLRYRADLSKTKLSYVLSDLEKKGLIKKVSEGKKNKIYLKNAF